MTNENVKELRVRKADNFGNLEIYYENGGEVPAVLKGLYTTYNMAEHAIAAYQEMKGYVAEEKQRKAEIKSIVELDHETFDDDDLAFDDLED